MEEILRLNTYPITDNGMRPSGYHYSILVEAHLFCIFQAYPFRDIFGIVDEIYSLKVLYALYSSMLYL